MSRKPRQYVKSKYLHIITRGIGKQILFEAGTDYLFYLSLLRRHCSETEIKVISYCLMNNHVHLLVYDELGNISLLMQKIGICYSSYYNKKYERTGHLFQDRFKSEVISDEQQLLKVFRYILRNPEKAGICAADKYNWSSYYLYGKESDLVDTSVIQQLLGTKYKDFIAESNDDEFMEYFTEKHDDTWANKLLRQCLNIESGTILQSYSKSERDKALLTLLRNNIPVRQLSRLTGISRGVIGKLSLELKEAVCES